MKKSKKKKTQTNKSDSTMVQSPGNMANFYTLSYLIFIIVYKLKAFLLQGASNHEKTNKRNNLALLDVARGGGGGEEEKGHALERPPSVSSFKKRVLPRGPISNHQCWPVLFRSCIENVTQ